MHLLGGSSVDDISNWLAAHYLPANEVSTAVGSVTFHAEISCPKRSEFVGVCGWKGDGVSRGLFA